MARRIFLSYSHRQAQWVRERLLPVLRAAGCEVLLDTERFKGGHAVKGQMDACQDQADVSLLVLSPDYLQSDYCLHEMNRAIAADPDFSKGMILPVVRASCDMSAFQRNSDPLLWVDLVDDSDAAPWDLVLRSLEAPDLRTTAPHWLNARDELVRKLRDQGQSVNLVIHGRPNWRALRNHLKADWLPDLAIVDLDDPATITRDGLVRTILAACGGKPDVPPPPRDLEALNSLLGRSRPVQLALLHFEHVRDRSDSYRVEIFYALRHLLENRSLVLLIESRILFRDLIPADHPLSNLDAHTVELRER